MHLTLGRVSQAHAALTRALQMFDLAKEPGELLRLVNLMSPSASGLNTEIEGTDVAEDAVKKTCETQGSHQFRLVLCGFRAWGELVAEWIKCRGQSKGAPHTECARNSLVLENNLRTRETRQLRWVGYHDDICVWPATG